MPCDVSLSLLALCGGLLAAVCTEPASVSAQERGQTIIRCGQQTPVKGSPAFHRDRAHRSLYAANNAMRSSGGSVTFEPGARSHWHVHPVGQVLIVTAGVGLTQEWGKPIQEIRGRRRGHLPGQGQALARSRPRQRHDAHLHLRRNRARQGRGMAGTRYRQPVRRPLSTKEIDMEKHTNGRRQILMAPRILAGGLLLPGTGRAALQTQEAHHMLCRLFIPIRAIHAPSPGISRP